MFRFFRERARAAAINSLGILTIPEEPGLNRFVERAADAFAAPFALLNVIHGEQLWVKASEGVSIQCMPRQESFCQYALGRPDILEVCDAAAAAPFRDLPAVTGDFGIRYYIGARLTIADGTDIGALCVLDTRPRPPASPDQRAYLLGLARQASAALERHADRRGSLAA